MTIDARGPVPGLTAETEVIYVNSKTAVCDGGVGVLGHPRVFLAIDQSGEVECPYCSRLFVFAPDRAGADRPTELPGHVPGPKPR